MTPAVFDVRVRAGVNHALAEAIDGAPKGYLEPAELLYEAIRAASRITVSICAEIAEDEGEGALGWRLRGLMGQGDG